MKLTRKKDNKYKISYLVFWGVGLPIQQQQQEQLNQTDPVVWDFFRKLFFATFLYLQFVFVNFWQKEIAKKLQINER